MSSAEFSRIPDNHVLGVLRDPRHDTLATDLRSAGYSTFMVLTAEEVGDRLEAKTEHANPIRRVIEQVRNRLTDEVQYLEAYEQEAEAGYPVIAVEVETERQAEHVADILQRNQVSGIRFFSLPGVKEFGPAR